MQREMTVQASTFDQKHAVIPGLLQLIYPNNPQACAINLSILLLQIRWSFSTFVLFMTPGGTAHGVILTSSNDNS